MFDFLKTLLVRHFFFFFFNFFFFCFFKDISCLSPKRPFVSSVLSRFSECNKAHNACKPGTDKRLQRKHLDRSRQHFDIFMHGLKIIKQSNPPTDLKTRSACPAWTSRETTELIGVLIAVSKSTMYGQCPKIRDQAEQQSQRLERKHRAIPCTILH